MSSDWQPVPLLYADAHFKGDVQHRASDLIANKAAFGSEAMCQFVNGFGAILFLVYGRLVYFFGRMPAQVRTEFAAMEQFIFLLEAVASILGLFIFLKFLRGPYFSFVDNTSAQFALTKGYSTDDAVNALSSIFWATAAETATSPWFERLSTNAKYCRCRQPW